MAKTRSPRPPRSPFDVDKFESIYQVGGIRTGQLDYPDAGGAPGCRVAMVDTGGGLRFTVALDRGGDIVEANYNQTNLAYLTPNGYKPPNHAYHQGLDWLYGWPGGLLTTCGPQYIGPPREEDGQPIGLHGHHSNTPAALTEIKNPDPKRGKLDMALTMTIRDSRMFGPLVEVQRRIECTLGKPVIHLHDKVTNLGSTRVAHNWLYHVNLGYPLLDRGAQLIYRGKAMSIDLAQNPSNLRLEFDLDQYLASADANVKQKNFDKLKRIPDGLAQHAGAGERCIIVEVAPDHHGLCHAGLINAARNIGFELTYPVRQMPRLVNWQHLGPTGSYVTAVEPFCGSLLGKDNDDHPQAAQWLRPGQSKKYDLTINIHSDKAALAQFKKHDGPVTSL